MSNFTDNELEYLKTQRLGRLATVAEDGQPQNAPVGYRYNPELDMIEITGFNLSNSKKFRNIQTHPTVSFVVDDVLPPWKPRGVEIRGVAEALPEGGSSTFDASYVTDSALIRIKPTQIIGWGIDTDAYKPNNRKVE